MSALERRLQKIEADNGITPMTAAEADRKFDQHLAEQGITKEQVIAQHGSLAAYAYARMCAAGTVTTPEPDDGKTPEQRYLDMIRR